MIPTPFSSPVFPAPNQINLDLLSGTRFACACGDLAKQHQLKEDMAALSLLGAISVAVQGRYDVVLPHGATVPLSLYTLIIAASGEGKSAAYNKTMAPLKRVQRECYEEYTKERVDFSSALTAWEAVATKLKADMQKAAKQNKGIEEAKHAYRCHAAKKPSPPREFRLLYPDATPAALFEGLQNILPTGALVTDEGDTYFSGAMRQARGHMNNLWGGEDLVISRATKEDIVLYDPRYGMHISIQPGVLERHLKPEDRDSGWAARFIVCAPEPVRGTRQYHLGASDPSEGWQWADQRLEALVRENLDLLATPNLPRHPLLLTQEAQYQWVRLANEIEYAMGPGRRFEACSDHAGKLSNQIGRMAALLHLFEGYAGDISASTLDMASHLCSYFSQHFQQALMPPPQDIQDAMLLRQWFAQLFQQHRWLGIPYNGARQRGPNPLRNAKRLSEAVSVLCFEGIISVGYEGKTRMIYFLNV